MAASASAQRLVGNQLMLLGHGIDRQRQEVQQLGVTKGAEAQRAGFQREVVQGIEHALQQHVGRGHQRVRQMPQALEQFFHQLFAALAAERFAVFDQDLAVEPGQRLLETGGPFLADAQFGAGTDQRDLFGQRIKQAAGQLQAGLAVVADHRAEMLGLHDPVDGDDRNAFGLQLAVAVIARPAGNWRRSAHRSDGRGTVAAIAVRCPAHRRSWRSTTDSRAPGRLVPAVWRSARNWGFPGPAE